MRDLIDSVLVTLGVLCLISMILYLLSSLPSPAKKPQVVVEKPQVVADTTPPWSITDDLTRQSRITTYILTDPYGRKLLVIKGDGLIVRPYEEPQQTLEKKE